MKIKMLMTFDWEEEEEGEVRVGSIEIFNLSVWMKKFPQIFKHFFKSIFRYFLRTKNSILKDKRKFFYELSFLPSHKTQKKF